MLAASRPGPRPAVVVVGATVLMAAGAGLFAADPVRRLALALLLLVVARTVAVLLRRGAGAWWRAVSAHGPAVAAAVRPVAAVARRADRVRSGCGRVTAPRGPPAAAASR